MTKRTTESPIDMHSPSEERHRVSLADEVMDGYAGTYKLNESIVMTVARDADHLSTRLTGQAWVAHYPMSDTEFFATIVDATLSFARDEQGHATSLTLHQHGKHVTMQRIDAADAQRIEASMVDKIHSQLATPGSEAALRRLIDGITSGAPDFAEMSNGLADATREQLPRLQAGVNHMGVVQTVQFLGVGNQGWDVYHVRHERGSSIWRIAWSGKVIDGALVASGP